MKIPTDAERQSFEESVRSDTYKAISGTFMLLEGSQLIDSHGHMLAQMVADYARDLLRVRWNVKEGK